MNPTLYLDLIEAFGLPLVLLVVSAWAFGRGHLRFGREYESLAEEHDRLEKKYESLVADAIKDAEESKKTVQAQNEVIKKLLASPSRENQS